MTVSDPVQCDLVRSNFRENITLTVNADGSLIRCVLLVATTVPHPFTRNLTYVVLLLSFAEQSGVHPTHEPTRAQDMRHHQGESVTTFSFLHRKYLMQIHFPRAELTLCVRMACHPAAGACDLQLRR